MNQKLNSTRGFFSSTPFWGQARALTNVMEAVSKERICSPKDEALDQLTRMVDEIKLRLENQKKGWFGFLKGIGCDDKIFQINNAFNRAMDHFRDKPNIDIDSFLDYRDYDEYVDYEHYSLREALEDPRFTLSAPSLWGAKTGSIQKLETELTARFEKK